MQSNFPQYCRRVGSGASSGRATASVVGHPAFKMTIVASATALSCNRSSFLEHLSDLSLRQRSEKTTILSGGRLLGRPSLIRCSSDGRPSGGVGAIRADRDDEDGGTKKKRVAFRSPAWQKPVDRIDHTGGGITILANRKYAGSVKIKSANYSALFPTEFSAYPRKTNDSRRKVSTGAQAFVDQIGSKAERRLRHLLFSESEALCSLPRLPNNTLWSFLNDALRQRNWRGALDVFAAMKQIQGYQADVRMYTMMVRIMGKSKQPYRAFLLFEEMEGTGCGWDVSAFKALLDAYGRSGLLEQAVAVFEQMKTTPACKPNVYTYNCMINAYGQAQLWDKINTLSIEMEALGVKPLDMTFNVLISVYGKGAFYDRMEKVFVDMQKAGCKPDVFTFNTMINAYGKGLQYSKMEETYKQMSSFNCLPDILTYSSLMDAYRKAGLHEKVEETLGNMRKAGCKLDVKAYSLLIDIFGKQGKLEKMEATLMEMESAGCKANVVTYTGILDAYGKAGLYEKMEEVWRGLNNMHLKPDISAYVTMLRAYGKCGWFDKMEMTFGELKTMVKGLKVVGPNPGCHAYNVIIDAYGKGKGTLGKMRRAFEDMQLTGHQPTVITYTVLIDAYGKAGLATKMERVYRTMRVSGCSPNLQTYGCLIDGYGRLGMVNKAEKVVKDLQSAGYELDLVTYTCIIDAYGRAKDFQTMVRKFHEMKAAGYEPSPLTIGVILSGLSKCHTRDDAASILHSIRPDSTFSVVERLLDMGAECDGTIITEDVENFFKGLREFGKESVLYDALIDLLWSFGLQKRALQILNFGRRKGAFVHTQGRVGTEIVLDLHLLSSSVAEVMLVAWLNDLRAELLRGTANAEQVSVVTGWGKRSKIEGDSPLKAAVGFRLDAMGSPFRVPRDNGGRFVAKFDDVACWLLRNEVFSLLHLRNSIHPGHTVKHCLPSV